MIKNVVFDIGNVLAEFRWKNFIADLGYEGETAERLAKATTQSPLWSEVDKGAMTLDDIITGMIASDPGIEKEIRHFFRDRRELVTEYEYSRNWILGLKNRGYKIYLLSNFSGDHFDYINEAFSFFGLEDGMVISYREKVLKPEARIYNILFERYKLNPKECVFLDDTPANIKGSEAVGMKGIVFTGFEEGSRMLEDILKAN